jgi:hypothetical protein
LADDGTIERTIGAPATPRARVRRRATRYTRLVRSTTPLGLLATLALGVACTAPLDGLDARVADDDGGAPLDGGPAPARPRERCNGLDDDGDGKIDEGCPLRAVVDVDRGRAAPWRWVSDDGALVLFTRASQSGLFGGASIWIAERGRGERLLLDGWSAPVLSASSRRVAAYRQPTYSEAIHRVIEVDVATGAPLRTVTIPDTIPTSAYVYGPSYVGDELALTIKQIDTDQLEVYFVDAGGQLRPMIPGTPAFRLRSDGRAGLFTGGTGATSRLYAFTLDPTPHARPLYEAAERHELYPLAVRGRRALVQESAFFDGDCSLALVDLDSGARSSIPGCATSGALGADVVVLEDSPPGGRLRVRALADGVERPLTTYASFATAPIVTGSTLSWIDDRAGTFDVYQMDLSDFAEGDFFPEGRSP